MTAPSWLSALKVGDEVGINPSWYLRHSVPYPVKVVRITPSGRIVVNDQGREKTFHGNGLEHTGSRHAAELVEWTVERQEALRKQNLVKTLESEKWFTLPLAVLEKIARVIAEEEVDGP